MVARFVGVCRRRGLKVNESKSTVMVMNGDEELECKVHIDGIRLGYVSEFKYLGCVLDEAGSESRRSAKLKDRKTNKFSLSCPKLWAWLQRDFHPSGASYRFGNPKMWVHPTCDVSRTPPHKPRHSLLSCTILYACLTSKPHFFKQSFTISIHLFHGLPTERLLAHSPT